MSYNLTNVTNAISPNEIVREINRLSGNNFIMVLNLTIYFIVVMALIRNDNMFVDKLIAAGAIVSVLNLLWIVAGISTLEFAVIQIIIFGFSSATLYAMKQR